MTTRSKRLEKYEDELYKRVDWSKSLPDVIARLQQIADDTDSIDEKGVLCGERGHNPHACPKCAASDVLNHVSRETRIQVVAITDMILATVYLQHFGRKEGIVA